MTLTELNEQKTAAIAANNYAKADKIDKQIALLSTSKAPKDKENYGAKKASMSTIRSHILKGAIKPRRQMFTSEQKGEHSLKVSELKFKEYLDSKERTQVIYLAFGVCDSLKSVGRNTEEWQGSIRIKDAKTLLSLGDEPAGKELNFEVKSFLPDGKEDVAKNYIWFADDFNIG